MLSVFVLLQSCCMCEWKDAYWTKVVWWLRQLAQVMETEVFGEYILFYVEVCHLDCQTGNGNTLLIWRGSIANILTGCLLEFVTEKIIKGSIYFLY